MKYELLTLADDSPYTYRSTPVIPTTWASAAADGWQLISVVPLDHSRLAYFQRPLAEPMSDALLRKIRDQELASTSGKRTKAK